MPEPTLGVLCCGLLRREVAGALARCGLDRAAVSTFPTTCHQGGPADPRPAAAMERLLETCDQVVALCVGCCRPGVLGPPVPGRLAVISVRTQAELLVGEEVATREADSGAFLVLPGWLQAWRRIVNDDWGFDREGARAFFRQASDRLLLLDTGAWTVGASELDALAEYVDLPAETRFVGLDYLAVRLGSEVDRLRAQSQVGGLERRVAQSQARTADHAAVVDFVTTLGNLPDEASVIASMEELVRLIFGPAGTRFIPAVPGGTGGAGAGIWGGSTTSSVVIRDGASLELQLRYATTAIGSLIAEDLALPDQVERYLPMAQAVADASSVAIHARRLLDREKRLTTDLASKVDELDAFVSSVAHGLKQPLAVASGFASMLEQSQETLPPPQRRFVTLTAGALQRMRTLIDELLRLSRVGGEEATAEVFALGDLAQELAQELAPELGSRRATLRIGALPHVLAVRRWTHEVLHNLLTNAIKYSPAEGVAIEVGACGAEVGEGGRRMAVVYVRDQGRGIAPDDARRVFDMFARVGPVTEVEGTGVGLAIARRAVQREGGRIWVESQLGRGSTFYFTLPQAAASDEAGQMRAG